LGFEEPVDGVENRVIHRNAAALLVDNIRDLRVGIEAAMYLQGGMEHEVARAGILRRLKEFPSDPGSYKLPLFAMPPEGVDDVRSGVRTQDCQFTRIEDNSVRLLLGLDCLLWILAE